MDNPYSQNSSLLYIFKTNHIFPPLGHYVYIEANGHRQGAKARLIAPSYSGRSSTCFQFYYNMHGQQIGTLSVYKKTARGLGSPIWSLSGDQGTGWQFGQVSIRGGTAYSVSKLQSLVLY